MRTVLINLSLILSVQCVNYEFTAVRCIDVDTVFETELCTFEGPRINVVTNINTSLDNVKVFI